MRLRTRLRGFSSILVLLAAACASQPGESGKSPVDTQSGGADDSGGARPPQNPEPTGTGGSTSPGLAEDGSPMGVTEALSPDLKTGLNHQAPDLSLAGGGHNLRVTVDRPKVIHFEYSATAQGEGSIPTSMMLLNGGNPPSAPEVTRDGSSLSTERFSITAQDTDLCFTVKAKGADLATICPTEGGLSIGNHDATHAYGLGQHFVESSQFGDLTGRTRPAGNQFGNAMTGYADGYTGNTQIPLLVALGDGDDSFGLLIDVVEAQTWDLTGDDWQMTTPSKEVRGFLVEGDSPLDVRRTLMSLVGTPPVPPKSAFGLWVSEYGYDNAEEAESKINTLRAANFPLDGIVLDLQWFGDFEGMGSLTFDETRFPNPENWIQKLDDEKGVSVIVIEESYIREELPEYTQLKDAGALVRMGEGGEPVPFDTWWGKGSMLDWTNEPEAAKWHTQKRSPLAEMGIVGHWTDLGEPESYNPSGWYVGGAIEAHGHAQNHNLYNLFWAKSIAEGYSSSTSTQRPFILTRSGSAGIQKYGAVMWSGDIATNEQSLEAHFDAQTHMVFSGIDYYGSDIGGFHRKDISQEDLDELYTYWFATSSLTDVPVRPHTLNRWGGKETAPDRVGDTSSNLENIRLRYRLMPYYYSLAHQAWRHADPVVAPLVMNFPSDAATRDLHDHKMLGDELLFLVATSGDAAQMYLPAGDWCDFKTGEWTSGGSTRAVALKDGAGDVHMPLFARAGAIIPMTNIKETTWNTTGRTSDNASDETLILRVFGGPQKTSFTLFEDDGRTVAYLNGATRQTTFSQETKDKTVTVHVGAASGTVSGLPTSRPEQIEIFAQGEVDSVTLNGQAVEHVMGSAGQIVVKQAAVKVTEERTYVVTLK